MAVFGFSCLALASLQTLASAVAGLRSVFVHPWQPPTLTSLQFGRARD